MRLLAELEDRAAVQRDDDNVGRAGMACASSVRCYGWCCHCLAAAVGVLRFPLTSPKGHVIAIEGQAEANGEVIAVTKQRLVVAEGDNTVLDFPFSEQGDGVRPRARRRTNQRKRRADGQVGLLQLTPSGLLVRGRLPCELSLHRRLRDHRADDLFASRGQKVDAGVISVEMFLLCLYLLDRLRVRNERFACRVQVVRELLIRHDYIPWSSRESTQ